MNSIPAESKASRMAAACADVIGGSPSTDSARTIVAVVIVFALAANSFRCRPRRLRASRICRPVMVMRGQPLQWLILVGARWPVNCQACRASLIPAARRPSSVMRSPCCGGPHLTACRNRWCSYGVGLPIQTPPGEQAFNKKRMTSSVHENEPKSSKGSAEWSKAHQACPCKRGCHRSPSWSKRRRLRTASGRAQRLAEGRACGRAWGNDRPPRW